MTPPPPLPGLGLALWGVLALPPVARGLEATLAGHMLVQIPLLAAAGALAALWPSRRVERWMARFNDNGAPGVVAATALLLFWMLPRALDAALVSWPVEAFKFLAVPMIGAGLVLGWPRMNFVGRSFVGLNAISMFAADGWLYLIAPVRLCTAYLIDDQAIVGGAFLAAAALILLRVLSVLLFGAEVAPRRLPPYSRQTMIDEPGL